MSVLASQAKDHSDWFEHLQFASDAVTYKFRGFPLDGSSLRVTPLYKLLPAQMCVVLEEEVRLR